MSSLGLRSGQAVPAPLLLKVFSLLLSTWLPPDACHHAPEPQACASPVLSWCCMQVIKQMSPQAVGSSEDKLMRHAGHRAGRAPFRGHKEGERVCRQGWHRTHVSPHGQGAYTGQGKCSLSFIRFEQWAGQLCCNVARVQKGLELQHGLLILAQVSPTKPAGDTILADAFCAIVAGDRMQGVAAATQQMGALCR